MYLIDTNIFLELLLEQIKAKEVEHFLKKVDTADLYISEFTIYSMGIILFRLNKHNLFSQWIDDLRRAGVQLVRLEPIDLMTLMESTADFNLDFDDAYQYKVAEKYDLLILSFDKDFDRTDRERKEPGYL